MKRVYVSATYNDLKDHREAVTRALRKMGYEVHCMEDYVATDERTDAQCTNDVSTCDFYVGILALRYGWIPPGQDRSITELEYQQARNQPKTRCLMFLLKDEASWPQKWIDAVHNPDAAAKLRSLRTELNGVASGWFSTVPDLVQEVMAAIHMEDAKTWKLALKAEFEHCVRLSRVEPLAAPEGFRNNYKLFLNSSDIDEIIRVLQIAIGSVGAARLVRVDLAADGGWWPTRLLLLASLLEDYTKVAKLVFANDGEYLGNCGLSDTRRAIGEAFPNVARAMAECRPDQPGFDPTADIPMIVGSFSDKLSKMGGEGPLSQPVKPHVVARFRGFNGETVLFGANPDSTQTLRELVGKNYQFVALKEPTTSDITIVDRLLFASRVAGLALDRL